MEALLCPTFPTSSKDPDLAGKSLEKSLIYLRSMGHRQAGVGRKTDLAVAVAM